MKEFKFFKGIKVEPLYWRTAMGEYKLLSEMSNGHIFNICTMLHGDAIPDPYLNRTREEWRYIFENELRCRLNG
jgi:hypothetical protein